MFVMKKKMSISIVLAMLFVSCGSNHTSEFNSISRNDIQGYEKFIERYPTSAHVADARERIEVAREEQRLAEETARRNEEQRRLESQYGTNSLYNGSQPYSQWYGKNAYYDDYTPHSEICVEAPYNSDVIAIVRRDNHNGKVVGHAYIKAGNSVTLYLQNGSYYQTFFYYGKGWYPEKQMKNGIKGGFIKDEAYSKDGTPSYLNNNVLTYELTITEHGNFSTSTSNENEIF